VARVWILLLAVAAFAGCSATAGRRTDLAGASAVGSDDAARLARLEHIGRQVTPVVSPSDAITFGLSSRGALGAWSWPDGRIRASRALVDLLDDDELAAALAHEVGHLVDGGHIAGEPAALSGIRGTPGSEARADVLGCRILVELGRRPETLPRMLRTVAAGLARGAEGPDPEVMLARASAAAAPCSKSP